MNGEPDPYVAPYRLGPDSAGADEDGPFGGENVLPADPNDPPIRDPATSQTAYWATVIELLTEIRDALMTADAP